MSTGCEVCGAPLRTVHKYQQKRFCGNECARNQGVLRSKVCGRCGLQRPKEMYSNNRHNIDGLQRWCRPCHRAYISDHDPESEDFESPKVWDGKTQLSDIRILRPYQVVCLQAGHVMRRVRLTEFQAARIVILGFKTRCDVCGGWLLLESDEDGQIGGGVQAHTVMGGHWWPESAA